MEMNLQPLATTCFVSGDPFIDGERVVSHLMQSETMEIMRYDVLESQLGEFLADGTLVCSWAKPYNPRVKGENPERELKLTAENLFITLADPSNEPSEENTRLVLFLALMLERKRLLRPKGLNATRDKTIYEHAKSKERYEVEVGEYDPAFFIAVQEQLSVLVGSSEPETPEVKEAPEKEPAV